MLEWSLGSQSTGARSHAQTGGAQTPVPEQALLDVLRRTGAQSHARLPRVLRRRALSFKLMFRPSWRVL